MWKTTKNHSLAVAKKCVETYSSRFRDYTLISQKEKNPKIPDFL